MEKMIDNMEQPEKVILVAVSLDTRPGETDLITQRSLDELEELVETAGAVTVGRIIQNREAVHNGTYIGKGKIEELKALICELEADAIVTDDELSPAQMRNLEDVLEVKICDRTMIILDIFAKHARTREGKIQVELAQLKYSLQRLTGKGIAMSRLGGGIGTRGPGEKKLEQDRRLIRDRISHLKGELEDIVKNREILRRQREKNEMPVIAIVGYTNAGKSTLLNKLTDSDILAKDMLFATLDATTRNLKISGGQEVLLTDTVGFINKLPHHLVEAFKSTLEEASYADIILHVVDSSSEDAFTQMAVVYETLSRLKADGKPVITAFNKQDKGAVENLKDLKADYVVKISAKTGDGLDGLGRTIEQALKDSKVYIEKTIPYSEGAYLNQIRRYGQVEEMSYNENGTFVRAYVPKRLM
ncbi:MAG: GTPase HflX [Clostridiales bacterium]|nr:GTPase HflX [Clostridiales bacterium]